MADIQVPKYERGVTRVLSLSMDAASARILRGDPEQVRALLGGVTLNPAGVEVFPLADLESLGLVGYLREGVDAQAADLARDGAKLAALDGWVMLLHSSAFEGREATLNLATEVTLIGTYAQQNARSEDVVLESGAAQPYSGPPPEAVPVSDRRFGSLWLVLSVMVFLGCILAFFALQMTS
jgi:hypothetical protein